LGRKKVSSFVVAAVRVGNNSAAGVDEKKEQPKKEPTKPVKRVVGVVLVVVRFAS
jgi:hypothetical protein